MKALSLLAAFIAGVFVGRTLWWYWLEDQPEPDA